MIVQYKIVAYLFRLGTSFVVAIISFLTAGLQLPFFLCGYNVQVEMKTNICLCLAISSRLSMPIAYRG